MTISHVFHKPNQLKLCSFKWSPTGKAPKYMGLPFHFFQKQPKEGTLKGTPKWDPKILWYSFWFSFKARLNEAQISLECMGCDDKCPTRLLVPVFQEQKHHLRKPIRLIHMGVFLGRAGKEKAGPTAGKGPCYRPELRNPQKKGNHDLGELVLPPAELVGLKQGDTYPCQKSMDPSGLAWETKT